MKRLILFSTSLMLIATLWIDVFPFQKNDSRKLIFELDQAINLNTDYLTVQRLGNKEMYSNKFRVDQYEENESSAAAITFSSRLEFPGLTTSWIFMVFFKGGKVVGKGVRVYEGWYRPCDAPIDLGEIVGALEIDGKKCF